MCFSEKNGFKSAFLRQRLPLSFRLYLKTDNGFNQPYFPKIFFGFLQPSVQASYVCLNRKPSERVARARGKKSQNRLLLSGHNFHASEVISIDTTIFQNHTGFIYLKQTSEIILTSKVCTFAVHTVQTVHTVHTMCMFFNFFVSQARKLDFGMHA